MTSGLTYRTYFPSLLVKELGRTIGAPSLPIVVAEYDKLILLFNGLCTFAGAKGSGNASLHQC
jgi:hypothetical protein